MGAPRRPRLPPGLTPEDLEAAAARETERRYLEDYIAAADPSYVWGWWNRHLCAELQHFARELVAGRQPRLIVSAPPQHGKTELIARRFIPWMLGQNPKLDAIYGTYNQDRADDVSREIRANARGSTQWWPHLAPGEADGVKHWVTAGGGSLKARGVGVGIAGNPADLIVLDDTTRNAEEARSATRREAVWRWYTMDAYTRLSPRSGVVVMNTRWHTDDLVGRLLAEEKRGGDRWRVVNFEAIATRRERCRAAGEALHPQRRDLAMLRRIERVLGPYAWSALYQGNPVAAAGHKILRAWMGRRWDFDAERELFDEWALSIDTNVEEGADNDYTVMQVWGRCGDNYYLLDQVRGVMSWLQMKAAGRDLRTKWPRVSTILVENKALGPALARELAEEFPGVVQFNPGTSKEGRVELASIPAFSAGRVWLPPRAPWLNDYVEEHVAFGPGCDHDDQVDATSQMLLYWMRGQSLKLKGPTLDEVNAGFEWLLTA